MVLPDGTLFGEGVKTRLKEHLLEECNLHTIVRLPNRVFKPYARIGTNLLFFEKGEPTKDIWFYEHRVPEGQKAYSMTKPIRFEHLQGCIDWWGGTKRKGREETPRVEGDRRGGEGARLQSRHQEPAHGRRRPRRPGNAAGGSRPRRGRDGGLARPVEGDPRRGAGSMNAERLLAHYEQIADAPDAIARLRRFILDLAVRGKLVPQDPNDEPASELLKRIAKEKARLVKAGELRDRPPLPVVAKDETPFGVPATWLWVRFSNIVDFSAGRTPSRHDPSFWNTGDHAWVSIADMEDGQVLFGDERDGERASTRTCLWIGTGSAGHDHYEFQTYNRKDRAARHSGISQRSDHFNSTASF